MVLVTVHIVIWYVLGIQIAGSIGIEAFFSGLSRGVLNMGFVFWMLVFVSALVLGRAFCGWFCWFGGFQELVAWSVGKFKITIPRRLLLYLGILPFASAGLKIYTSLLVNWLRSIPPSYNFNLADMEPWGGQQTGISIVLTLVLLGPVFLFTFGERAWCRYLCPIGAILKVFSQTKSGKVRLVNDDCNGCGKCSRSCVMQVDVAGEIKTYGEVRSSNCIVCFKCTDDCPTQAIAFNLSRKRASLSPKAINLVERATARRRQLSAYDVVIAVLWLTATLTFTLASGGPKSIVPPGVKVLISPGLLLAIYGLVWAGNVGWSKFKARKQMVRE
jgi:polyferredoxin